MLSVNLTFDNAFFLAKIANWAGGGYKCVSIQNQLEYFCAQYSTLAILSADCDQSAALQQLSAGVFKLSFEYRYLHSYSRKVAIFILTSTQVVKKSATACQQY